MSERVPTRRAVTGSLIAMLAPATATAQTRDLQIRDLIGVPGPLSFLGVSYALSWTAQPSASYRKQEYLPIGVAKDRYAGMMLIETLKGLGVPQALGAQFRTVEQRKGRDPLANSQVIRNDRTGEAILDFLMGDRDAAGGPIAEWNAYRYIPWRSAAGDGVMLLGFSRRAYGDDAIRAFLASLKSGRQSEIAALAAYPPPKPRQD